VKSIESRLSLPVFTVMFTMVCWFVSAQSAPDWIKNSDMAGDTLTGVVYGRSLYVAVGSSGSIMTSPDGIAWIVRQSGTFDSIGSVAYGSSKFCAFANASDGSGTLCVSNDGITWTANQKAFETGGPSDVASNGSVFVGVGGKYSMLKVGGNDNLYYSPDGLTWTVAPSPVAPDILLDVAWDGRRFIAVGTKGAMIESTDGRTWNRIETGFTGNIMAAASQGAITVFVTEAKTIYYSNSSSAAPLEWRLVFTMTELPMPFLHVACGTGHFVATTVHGAVYESDNGIDWTIVIHSGGYHEIYLMTVYGGNQFIAVGGFGIRMISPDGLAWTQRAMGNRYLKDVASNGKAFCAIDANGTKCLSTDGLSWNRTNSNYLPALSVSWANGQFVILGNDGEISRSTDGTTWTIDETIGESVACNAAAWNGQLFAVAGDNGYVYTTPDFKTWTRVEQTGSIGLGGQVSIFDIASGGGRFVALKSGYVIVDETTTTTVPDCVLVSQDGVVWSKVVTDTPVETALTGVEWLDGRFVILRSDDTALVSTAGFSWQSVPTVIGNAGIEPGFTGDVMCKGAGQGAIALSTDGIDWTLTKTGIGESIKCVASDGKQLVAIASCSILRSTTLIRGGPVGDVNESGTIDIVDALLVARYSVGIQLSNFNSAYADVDRNGSVNIVDALYIAQCYVGLRTCNF
jgi:hypothetical protein